MFPWPTFSRLLAFTLWPSAPILKNIKLCPINILIMIIVRIIIIIIIPADIYLFKVNNKNTRRRCESVQSHWVFLISAFLTCLVLLELDIRSGDNLDMENMSDISLKGQKSKEKRQMLTKKTQKWRSFSNRH